MGTRFVATAEAPVHPGAKQAMVDHSELDTTLVMRTLRNTARVLSNEVAAKVVEVESRPGDTRIEDLIEFVAGSETRNNVWAEGDVDGGIVAAGQVMGLIRDVPTVAELVERIVAEAEEIVTARLAGMLGG
jgi:nitronate monooxygenase